MLRHQPDESVANTTISGVQCSTEVKVGMGLGMSLKYKNGETTNEVSNV